MDDALLALTFMAIFVVGLVALFFGFQMGIRYCLQHPAEFEEARAPWGKFEQRTGLDVVRAGAGGTGFATDGNFDQHGRYGSARRLGQLASMPEALCIITFGSVNDYNKPPAEVAAAATKCWNDIKVRRPQTPIVAMGLEVVPPGGTQHEAVNNALREAAEASLDVDKFIDFLEDPWLSGTGCDGSPAGDGNADAYLSEDRLHLTHEGCDELAVVIENKLATVQVPA